MLEVKGINTFYGGAHILRDLSLTVNAGEVVALLGRNGAGKSTTMKSIMGLARVKKGSVGIANGQSVIYPADLPGGWNLVGRTPLDLFSPCDELPCLLKGGDQIRFTAISPREFEALAGGESL